MAKNYNKTQEETLETQLWKAADKLRKNIDAAEYKHIVLGLIFLNTQIPASLWFMSRNKANGKYRDWTDEILFIDARNMGYLINRRAREFSPEDIQQVAETYHNWRNPDGDYKDVKGFCNSTSINRVKELDYVLTPGRYVWLAVEDDDFNFNERFSNLKTEFEEELKERRN